MIHTGNNGGECLSVESTSGTINQGVRAYLFPALTVVTIEFRPGSTDFLVRLLRLLPAGAKDAGWGTAHGLLPHLIILDFLHPFIRQTQHRYGGVRQQRALTGLQHPTHGTFQPDAMCCHVAIQCLTSDG